MEIVAHGLAARLFPDYGSPLPASSYYSPLNDNPLLESALGVPRQPYYRTIFDKAGALLRSMVKNHPFIDGNKRMGMATTSIFMLMNDYLFWPPNEEMVRFALELAASEPDMLWQEVASWVGRHSVSLAMEKEELWRYLQSHPRQVSPEARNRVLEYSKALGGIISELRESKGKE